MIKVVWRWGTVTLKEGEVQGDGPVQDMARDDIAFYSHRVGYAPTPNWYAALALVEAGGQILETTDPPVPNDPEAVY